MNNLLPSVLLFLLISVICCDGESLDPSPDVIEQCVNDDSCGANNASFVTFYHYVVDDDDDDEENSSNTTTTTIGSNNKGVQYTICATNSTGYVFASDTIISVEANSICKINEVTMVLPEDSNEKCSDLLSTTLNGGTPFSSDSDCLERCNNVIFRDWNEMDEANANTLDDDADFGESWNTVSTSTDSINGEEVCLCHWGNHTPIVGCVTRYTRAHSDANSIFITTSFATVVAVIVASATAIEMAFV